MNMSHRDGALTWEAAGMSVVPVVADGSKRPLGSWANYQQNRATRDRIDGWYKNTPEQGVGIICGKVSGNLEMTEIEAARMGTEYLDKIVQAMCEQDICDLWSDLTGGEGYCESTPSGGIHILYRISDQPVPGNTKIAMSENGKVTYAETRGEGGFVVVAPSSGTVHKTGDSWTVLAGRIGHVPTITWDERCRIHEALRAALDERVIPTYERPAGVQAYDKSQGERPGDAFEADPSVTIHDILTRNGWKYLGKSRGQDRYVHPHSSDMSTQSAVTGHKGSPNLYAWSGLPKEDYYTKYSLLAHLEFNGDFSACSRSLRSQGYGSQHESVDISDWFTATDAPAGVGVVVDEGSVAVPATEPSKALKLSEWTETGVGELLARTCGNDFRFVSDSQVWRFYRDGLWVKDQWNHVESKAARITKVLLSQAREAIKAAQENEDKDELKAAQALFRKAESFRSDRGARAVINRFGAQDGVRLPSSEFDANLDLIRFTNGTLDLATMTLREHRPDDMLTLDVGYAYDPAATCPMFDKFMAESLPDDDVRDYMKRVQGYTLGGRPNEGVWFALYGDTGCGKSTYLSILKAVMGAHARTAAQATFAQRNEGSRAANDLNDIRMARMVMISETKEGQLFNESLIKQYSGGDELNSHGLYEENGTWKNRGVLFMATNHPPRLSADDNANWRRVKMVEFPVSQYTNPNMNPDPKLADKIIDAELSGVMNWVLAGLVDYRAHGLGEPKVVTEAVRAHRVEVDPVSQFLNEGRSDGYITVGEDLEIPAPQLYKIFVNWCEDNGFKPFGMQRFGMRLTAMRFDVRRSTGGQRLRVGIGVGTRGALGSMGWNR